MLEIGCVGQDEGFLCALGQGFGVLELEGFAASFDELVDVASARVECGQAECAGHGCSPCFGGRVSVDEHSFEERGFLCLGEAVGVALFAHVCLDCRQGCGRAFCVVRRACT